MNRKAKKNSDKKREQKATPADDRDPAVIRAEQIRTSASRETVEAFVVAFILALLFRAFIAEAFVIPTGSMAPTLMGAHKDQTCDKCGYAFQVGASLERRGPKMTETVVAGICPNCRHTNPLDLAGTKNDSTFSGDRILVSKFAYTMGDPDRWDVIVFKFPGNPKQNYIKRLVGLPNETLTIHHGDIYSRPVGSDQASVIVRKPPDKIVSMRQLVNDSDYQSQSLIDAKYPGRWQPWAAGAEQPPTDSWQVKRSSDGLTATVDASDDKLHWLRYFHRWPDEAQWATAEQGVTLADVDPYSCRLVTDFYAYDSYIKVPAWRVYSDPPVMRKRLIGAGYSSGTFDPQYESGAGPEQFNGGASYGDKDLARDGLHWVGDLMFEADVDTTADCQELVLQLVEAGVEYRCLIDLTTGVATMAIEDVEPREFTAADGKKSAAPQAQTGLRAGSNCQLGFSNFDDELLLWIDGEVVSFDGPTTYDVREFRTDEENHPYYLEGDPLDGAPVGIAVRGGQATANHLEIYRDKYYIATKDSRHGLLDYDMSRLWDLTGGGVSLRDLQTLLAQPEKWSSFPAWSARRKVEFDLAEDQFFPMGDNSPESLDARCWARTRVDPFGLPERFEDDAYRWSEASYVPRDLLVGKALVVFWPHYWKSPVPFWPNFKRMKLIR
jgi:signal peptidase I